MTNRRFFPWFVRALALSALLVALACPMLGFDPCCECPPTALCYCETNPPDCPPPGNNNNGNNNCTDKYGNPIECPSNNNGNGDDNNNNDNELCYDKYGNPIDCPDNNNGGGCDACCGNPQYASAFPDQCSGNNNSPDPPQPPIVGKITIYASAPNPNTPCSPYYFYVDPQGKTWFGHTWWKIEAMNGYQLSADNQAQFGYILGKMCDFTATDVAAIGICNWQNPGVCTVGKDLPVTPCCVEFELTETQLLGCLGKTKSYDDTDPQYNLCTFNCTTSAIEVLEAAQQSWDFPSVRWNGPEDECPDLDCSDCKTAGKLSWSICNKNAGSPICPLKGD